MLLRDFVPGNNKSASIFSGLFADLFHASSPRADGLAPEYRTGAVRSENRDRISRDTRRRRHCRRGRTEADE